MNHGTVRIQIMTSRPCQILYLGPSAPDAGGGLRLWGKIFDMEAMEETSDVRRVLVHRDFPLLMPEDVAAFAEATEGPEFQDCVTMTGCRVEEDAHPYRLVREDTTGRLDYAVDIPQEVRGARQSYPELLRYVPAMVSIPAGVPLSALADPETFRMHRLDCRKLLDGADLREWLVIQAILNEKEPC